MDMGAGLAMGQMMMNQMNQMNQQGGGQQSGGGGESKEEIMKLLKDLGELKENGILTEEEFNQKKTELLSRL